MITATERSIFSSSSNKKRVPLRCHCTKNLLQRTEEKLLLKLHLYCCKQLACIFFKDQIPEQHNQNAFFACVINTVIWVQSFCDLMCKSNCSLSNYTSTWFFQWGRTYLEVYRHAWCKRITPQAESSAEWRSWQRDHHSSTPLYTPYKGDNSAFHSTGNVNTSTIFTPSSATIWTGLGVTGIQITPVVSRHETKCSVELLVKSTISWGRRWSYNFHAPKQHLAAFSPYFLCFIDSMKYRVKGSWICCLLRAFTPDVLSGERGKVLRHQAKE